MWYIIIRLENMIKTAYLTPNPAKYHGSVDSVTGVNSYSLTAMAQGFPSLGYKSVIFVSSVRAILYSNQFTLLNRVCLLGTFTYPPGLQGILSKFLRDLWHDPCNDQ